MQKKWVFASSIAVLACAVLTTISILVSADLVALILGVSTVLVAGATATAVHFTAEVPQIRNTRNVNTNSSQNSKPSEKHTESISHAVEPQSKADFDELANTESATTKTADVVEETHHDEESGLLSASFFPVYLDQRITAARRTLRPVSLVIFELDGLDKNDSHSPSDRNFYISAVGDVVKRTLRESDCAFRIDENIFAAAMDDTTESGAVWAAERVRGVLHTGALAGRVTVSAGVACYPSHALETEDLINCANKALAAAKARGVDQVEIAAETAAEQQ